MIEGNELVDKLEKVIKGLQIERECVSRDCDRNCGQCDLVQDRDWLLSVYDDALELLKEQETMSVDAFVQWCADSHIMGDASVKGIKYWAEKFKEVRRVEC